MIYYFIIIYILLHQRCPFDSLEQSFRFISAMLQEVWKYAIVVNKY